MTLHEETPPRRLRRFAVLGGLSLVAIGAAATGLFLLLPGDLAARALMVLVLGAVVAIAAAGIAAWPFLRRAALLREALNRTRLRYAAFAPDRTLIDRSAAYDLPGIDPRLVRRGLRLDDLIAAAQGPAPDPADLARQVALHEDDTREEHDKSLPDGRIIQVSKRRLEDGEVVQFARDVTRIRARETRDRAVQDSVPAAIWHLDAEGRTLSGNGRLVDLFGGWLPPTLAEAGLSPPGEPGPGPFGMPPGVEVEAILAARDLVPERRVIVVASPWLPGEDGGTRAVLMLLDVTPLHAARAEAVHFAWHDPLTGLPNRLSFQRALAEMAAAPGGGALILLDLSGLQAVNESLGLGAGDGMLRAAASRLRDQLRPTESAYRLGGDAFAVIARGAADSVPARSVAARMQDALSVPVDLSGGPTPLRACIGYAGLPLDATDAEALHRAAALALAMARRGGAGTTVAYDEALGERAGRRRVLREQLVNAVATGGFELAWQAQVDARSGALRGAEALLRWPAAPGGPVSPAEFLPEAEAAGLMPAIDAWVLEEALRQKAAWSASGCGPEVVGVNISPITLRDPGFPARVAASLARHGVAPQSLEVEIPEVVAASDLDAIAPVLHELIADGVRLSLDDFGGGSSALAHLLRLPVDQVKLDRSIVAGLPGGARERAILRAVAALAHGMEIPLLAEGVETDDQRDALLQEGCFVMQGWLFGRAVTPAQLLAR